MFILIIVGDAIDEQEPNKIFFLDLLHVRFPLYDPFFSHKSQVVEAPPGYMQALVRRIVSNITLRVHHLIVKYVQDDIVLSLNVKHLSVDSAGPDWQPAFAGNYSKVLFFYFKTYNFN